MRITICLVVLILLSGGCAGPVTPAPDIEKSEIKKEERIQTEMAFKAIADEDLAVMKVLYPILNKNASLCPKTAYDDGTLVWSRYLFDKEGRPYAERALPHVDEYVRVRHVFQDSPASEAGIKAGDIIIEINGKTIDKGRKGYNAYRNIFKNYKNPSVEMTLKRRELLFTVTLHFTTICDYKLQYAYKDNTINASANGKKIIMTRGMKRFVQNDDEMATVLAHELAHNTMEHIEKAKRNVALGYSLGIAANIAISEYAKGGVVTNAPEFFGHLFRGYKSVAFEQEADYVGSYFMERAGYDISVPSHFWRRMASENSISSIDLESSHPTSVKRFLALEKTKNEIERKTREGRDLVPNEKDRPWRRNKMKVLPK